MRKQTAILHKTFDILLCFGMIAFVLSCGSSPDDPPDLPSQVEWTSSIQITGAIEVEGETVDIDSIGVVLDGVDIGYLPNSSLIDDIPLGSYPLSTYYLYENVTYMSSIQTVTLSYGKIAEINAYLTRADLRGWLSIHATIEGADADSFRIWIDGVNNGFGVNPRVISNIAEGSHKVGIARWLDDVLWENCLFDVIIIANDTADIPVIDLSKVEPLVDSKAPDLYCIDIDGERVRGSGGEQATTNNRMELTAVIRALESISGSFEPQEKHVFTDSKYVKNGITSWIHTWKKNWWLTSAKKPVKNTDLWRKLDTLDRTLHPQWFWVQGHAGNELNEECDALVQKEISLIRTSKS